MRAISRKGAKGAKKKFDIRYSKFGFDSLRLGVLAR